MHIDYYHVGFFSAFSAGALRTANVANALALGGHTVTIITGDGYPEDITDSAIRFHLHDKVTVSAGGPALQGLAAKWIPKRINPLAQGIGREQAADVVLLFGGTPKTFGRLRDYATRTAVPLVVDVDEWMGPKDFSRLSWMTLFPLRYELYMRRLPKTVRSALAIGEAMQDHLASSGAKVMIVPPLHLPLDDLPDDQEGTDRGTRLLLPGVRRGGKGKDRSSLQLVSEAIELAPELCDNLIIDVVGGLDEKESVHIARRLGRFVELHDHGRVEWDRARQLLLAADWLVALRDPAVRRLRFGFPSKVTESLVVGTPVIANDYSDMRRYLNPADSGIFVERLDPGCVAEALKVAVARRLTRSVVARAGRDRYTPSAAASGLSGFLRAQACIDDM